MKLFRNFVTYFNVIWVICGEITYTSNIFEIDPLTVFPGPNPWFLWLSPNVFPKTILEYEIAQIFGVKILYYFERFSDILFCIPVNLE